MLRRVSSRSCQASPPDWMVSAALHVWTGRRSGEGAEVEGQGSGGRSGGVPSPETIKHLNIGGRMETRQLCEGEV